MFPENITINTLRRTNIRDSEGGRSQRPNHEILEGSEEKKSSTGKVWCSMFATFDFVKQIIG